MESEQKAFLVVNDDSGQSHMMIARLSNAEMAAYKSHPETFFGRVLSVSKNTEDPVDLYEFFIENYKKTPREKLLEFMNSAPDIEALMKLTDDELRFVYAERLTRGAMRDRKS